MEGAGVRRSSLTGVSLFASSGIGDLALRELGVEMLVANEIVPERASLFSANFPETLMIPGDIRNVSEAIIEATRDSLQGRQLDVLFATPPCQGMSKNGRGKLLRGVRDGLREMLDPRNQLATYVPPIAHALKPLVIVFENVPEMDGTLVQGPDGELIELLNLLEANLPDYAGTWRTVEFADFGVPQRRQRLITVFVHRDLFPDLADGTMQERAQRVFPRQSHSQRADLLTEPWVTVEDAIGHLPPLDAGNQEGARSSSIPFHYVPVLDDRKYWWVSQTPPGASAFDNQCVNPACGHDKNPTHGSSRESGVNQARRDTPILCELCGSVLPRPAVMDGATLRIMNGFTSAYKRMRGDLPASALTRNLSYVSSDQKIHPTQNRVLSLNEAMILHTIDRYDYRWTHPNGKAASNKLIRESIGESIPPLGLQRVLEPLMKTLHERVDATKAA